MRFTLRPRLSGSGRLHVAYSGHGRNYRRFPWYLPRLCSTRCSIWCSDPLRSRMPGVRIFWVDSPSDQSSLKQSLHFSTHRIGPYGPRSSNRTPLHWRYPNRTWPPTSRRPSTTSYFSTNVPRSRKTNSTDRMNFLDTLRIRPIPVAPHPFHRDPLQRRPSERRVPLIAGAMRAGLQSSCALEAAKIARAQPVGYLRCSAFAVARDHFGRGTFAGIEVAREAGRRCHVRLRGPVGHGTSRWHPWAPSGTPRLLLPDTAHHRGKERRLRPPEIICAICVQYFPVVLNFVSKVVKSSIP